MITIYPTYLFISNKWMFVGLCAALCSIFLKKNSSQITHVNHMTMTTSGQILSWPDYHKTKENVKPTLLDLYIYILYKVVIGAFFGIGLWTENVALKVFTYVFKYR